MKIVFDLEEKKWNNYFNSSQSKNFISSDGRTGG
jgi:hypothetical protein